MRPAEMAWGEAERRRLVRLCAAITGDRDAAEDLAQETLLEAWRNAHKLRDPAGADRWLAAIARNVCLRWSRRRGRDLRLVAGDAEAPDHDALDVEVELERAELGDLLDRALALLPHDTREVLIGRYVEELPYAEIGARLGLSEDAVSMRLSRGKLVLRRVLASDLRAESAAHGLVEGSDDGWRETRVWCSDCGRRRLLVRMEPPPGAVSFRCPGCVRDAAVPGSAFSLANPFFVRLVGDLVRPAAILTRAARWSHAYFGGGVERSVACTRCGRDVAVRRGVRGVDRDVLYAECEACGEAVSSSLGGLALTLPEMRRFRADHPRTRRLPQRDVQLAGAPAILVRYEDVLGSAGVDVLFARDTLRVLVVRGATG